MATGQRSRFPNAALMGLALVSALILATAGCKPSSPPKPKSKPGLFGVPAGPNQAGVRPEDQGETSPWDQFKEVLCKTVSDLSDPAVAAWADEGGPAQISFFGNTLVVAQTPAGLKKADDLLRALSEKGEVKVERMAELRDLPEDEALVRSRGLLAQKIELEVPEGTIVSELADMMNKQLPGLNLVVCEIPAGAETTLMVKVKGAQHGTAEQVLKEALSEEWVYTVHPGCVLVAGREAPGLATALYRLGPKPGAPPSGEMSGSFFDDIRGLVCKAVSNMSCPKVAAWADEGGPAVLEYFPRDILVVRQSEEGHRQLAALLDGLVRVGCVKGVTRVAVTESEESPEKDKVRAALRELMDINVKKTGLDKVLELIGQHGPQAVFDPDIASCGIDLTTRVVDLDLKRVPVGTLLDLVLGADLGYKVQPGFVMITTCDKLQQELPIVLYKVEPAASQAR